MNGNNGGIHETRFELTAACEVMATMTMARSVADLRERLAQIIVGFTRGGAPVTATDIRAPGAMMALLKDATRPNLAQTSEGTPVLIHCGPFGNVSTGCNSVTATRLGLHVADYCVTEAGFASDLGLEKFCDLICRTGGFAPSVAVIVATLRALKYHGGVVGEQLNMKNRRAIADGFANLRKHIENVSVFGLPCVVALNRFESDDQEEIAFVQELCRESGALSASADVWLRGSEGGMELARVVTEAANQPSHFRFLYRPQSPLEDKLNAIARTLYGATCVKLAPEAARKAEQLQALHLDTLPVCVAKTHLSLSDNTKLLNRPRDFTVTIQDLRVMAGAGLIIAYAGNILTMPGLQKAPAAERIEMTNEGRILGLV
jgi:formate--tetrahydrofolate ligase